MKKTKLAEIAALADPAAIIASNTTTLPISDLASACHHPERFLGTHFFAPVDRMELLEIVVGEKTAPETTDRAILLAKGLGEDSHHRPGWSGLFYQSSRRSLSPGSPFHGSGRDFSLDG